MKHLPNIFSFIRVLCSPIIFVLILMAAIDSASMGILMKWAFGLFVFAACTDWVDGTLARAMNATSELGAKLDLLADKLLVGVTLLGIILSNLVVLERKYWPLVIAIGAFLLVATSGRDYAVTILRSKSATYGLTMPATFLAKSKTAVIMSGIGIYLAAWPLDNAQCLTIGAFVLMLGALMSLYTGYAYFASYQKMKGEQHKKLNSNAN
ncbi:MAG: CDP-diacylglycerol--glycerol-3-phosphate 3-phosphatidyltransferase [Hyphomonadaceae bacterium]|nr:MAG: CDP-diacylglycerol--glycerol-3-phosphate 3-phosphatidyltransferase [Hyphomonadaceae bacterium]